MLIPYNEEYRTSWMIPRNIRKIYPWKVNQIIQALKDVVDNGIWEGNQDLQNSFIDSLNIKGLKSGSELIDKNSGGARTYISQLIALGLIYKDKKGGISYTIAGDELLNMKAPLPILQNQVLKMQYPSPYSLSPNVKINPKIRIKPFLFLLRLMLDSDLKYLDTKEIIIPVVFGHNIDCYSLVKNKILKFREEQNFKLIIDDLSYLNTRRIQVDILDEKILGSFFDIANTFKNYLESTNLIVSVDSKSKYVVNPQFLVEVESELKEELVFIPNPKNKEQFLRAYGAFNKVKDTRRPKTEIEKPDPEKNYILSQFVEFIGKNPLIEYPEQFIQDMVKNHGMRELKTREVIEPFLSQGLDHFESEYLRLSVGGQETARDFELSTTKLFNQLLGINAFHIGQKNNKSTIGGFPDILISLKNEAGYVDTKATPSYKLGSEDYAKMKGTYIPSFSHLVKEGEELSLILYVAGGFDKNLNARLSTLSRETTKPVSAISSRILLSLARESNKLKPEILWNCLKISKVIEFKDIIQK